MRGHVVGVQPSLKLQEAPPKPVTSPTGFVLGTGQKALLLVLILGVLYLRLWRRKRAALKICSHCGTKNPHHQSFCKKCSAPLFNI